MSAQLGPGAPDRFPMIAGAGGIARADVARNAREAGASEHYIQVMLRPLWRHSRRLGLNPYCALAVAALETGWGRFPGVVPDTFNNFGGLKVLFGGPDADPDAHAQFYAPSEGALALAQHLGAYAGLEVGRPVLSARIRWVRPDMRVDYLDELGNGRYNADAGYGRKATRIAARLWAPPTS